MALIPYLNFNGNTKEVIEFYVKVFDLEEAEIMYFKDMPNDPEFPITSEIENLVMHGSIDLDGDKIMFSDSISEMGPPLIFGNNLDIMYSIKDIDKLKTIFDKLAEGGTINMPFMPTFWSQGYGVLVDKFGVGWQLNLDE
ncbi:MAG: VOC family protein [Acidaminobacteraceae bacterium]